MARFSTISPLWLAALLFGLAKAVPVVVIPPTGTSTINPFTARMSTTTVTTTSAFTPEVTCPPNIVEAAARGMKKAVVRFAAPFYNDNPAMLTYDGDGKGAGAGHTREQVGNKVRDMRNTQGEVGAGLI